MEPYIDYENKLITFPPIDENGVEIQCDLTEGGVHDSLYYLIIRVLELADNDVSKIEIPWIKRAWESYLETIESFNISILNFANGRSSSDLLLAKLIQMIPSIQTTFIELPNLFPDPYMVAILQSATTNDKNNNQKQH